VRFVGVFVVIGPVVELDCAELKEGRVGREAVAVGVNCGGEFSPLGWRRRRDAESAEGEAQLA